MELLQDLNRDYRRYSHSPRERTYLGLNGLQHIQSSNVSSVGVKGESLIIRFHNGSMYEYPNQASQYENMLKSNSKGKWVWRNLRRKNVLYRKIGVLPLPDDIGVTDEEIFQEIDNRYMADLTRHVDVPVFQSFEFIKGINYQKIQVGNINVYKAITSPLEVLEQVSKIDVVADTKSFDNLGNELTPKQKDYFAESKIRDENGNLVKLFHGSPNKDIKQFSTQYKGLQSGVAEDVIYFTNSEEIADEFSAIKVPSPNSRFVLLDTGKRGKVYEVYMDMKNPLDMRNLTEKDKEFIAQSYAKTRGEDIETGRWFVKNNKNHQQLKIAFSAKDVQEAGYDGVIQEMYMGSGQYEYGVFDPNQIKFVDDTEPEYIKPKVVVLDEKKVDVDDIFDEDDY